MTAPRLTVIATQEPAIMPVITASGRISDFPVWTIFYIQFGRSYAKCALDQNGLAN
jgi:hypothetical protein